MSECFPDALYAPGQREKYRQAALNRRSVRAFCAAPDQHQMEALNSLCESVCLPGVRIVTGVCDDRLFVSFPVVGAVIGCRRYAAVIVDKTVPRSVLYAGVMGENLVLEAESMGLSTCWVAGSFRRSRVEIETGKNEKIAAVIAMGVSAETVTGARVRKKLSDICLQDPSSWPLWAFSAAENVRIAPSALNRQPWRLAFSGRTLLLKRAPMADDLSMGIALQHMICGIGEKPYHVTLGTKAETACLVSEDRTL